MSDVVPDYMNALVGYRAWNVTPEGDLISINTNTSEPWPEKTKKQAICTVVKDLAPWAPGTASFHSSTAYIPVPQAVMWAGMGSFERVWEKRKFAREIGNHHCPMPDCTCGIYAAKDGTSGHFMAYKQRGAVWGEVYLWGKIQEYTGGYRAEFAYPKSLCISAAYAALAPKIAERYGVPCVVDVSTRPAGWQEDNNRRQWVAAINKAQWKAVLEYMGGGLKRV